MEVKSLNPVTPFRLIMAYNQSSTKSVIPFTLFSASFFHVQEETRQRRCGSWANRGSIFCYEL